MCLSNKELYIYNSKGDKKEKLMVMLTSGVFVKGHLEKFSTH